MGLQFEVDRTRAGDTAVLTVRGELDIATAPVLGQSFEAVAAPDLRRVVLDLTDTAFVDSTACRLISQAAKRLDGTGGSLVIVCPDENWTVFRVLEFVGLTQVFDVRAKVPDDVAGDGRSAGG